MNMFNNVRAVCCLLLTLLLGSEQIAASKLDVSQLTPVRSPFNKINKILKDLRCRTCETAHPITRRDIDRNGFVITKPGVYCLSKDTSFDPLTPGLSAITVNVPAGISSDVVIDLNSNTLSQGNGTANTNGITVNGQTNVIVRNGTIRNFTNDGILVQNNSDQLIFENLNVLKNGTASGPVGVGGIVILGATNISLENVNARENFGVGVGLSDVNNFFMDKCHCDDTQGVDLGAPFGVTAIGFSAFVVDPPFASPKGLVGQPFTTASSNLFITNCSFNGTTGGGSAFAAIVGSLFGVRARNILFENCVATDTSSTLTSAQFAEGITVLGDNILIKDCVVDNLTSAGTFANHLVGIEITTATNSLVENCTVAHVSGSAIFVNGFDIEGTATNSTFRNCVAYDVTNTAIPTIANPLIMACGFALEKPILVPGLDAGGSGTVADSCIAQNVHGTTGSITAGILINAQTNVLVQNCVSNNNVNGILSTQVTTTGFPGFPNANGIYTNNTVENNSFAGFNDLATSSVPNNAYYSNSARSNGPGSLSNYVGAVFPSPSTCPTLPCTPVAGLTPLRVWDLSINQLCPVNTNCVMGDKLDNLDIRP